jgi:peptide/nickel transport system substrate-binding protein
LPGVTAAALATDPFNSAPTGTGPFMVAPNQDWQRSHTLRLSPNPVDWRQGSKLANIEFRFFPDQASLLAAFAVGEIQALNHVSPVALPQVAALPHTRLFTSSAPRYTALLFNLTDSGSPALRPVEGRRALAIALDRDALIDRVLNGQGLPLEGPYLPTSWAYNPNLLTVFNYDPATAAALLDSIGWSVAEGGSIRQREGTPLHVRLLAINDPTQAALAQAIAAQWASVGVETQVSLTSGLDELRQALSSRAFDVALVDIAPPGDPDLYDFWSQEAIIRGQNYAGWNNRRASEALESGRQQWAVADRRPAYDNFLRSYDSDLPALTLFQHVYTYGLSEEVQQVSGSGGDVQPAEIGLIIHPRDRYKTFADWFLFYRDVTVGCPAETPGSAGF